VYSPSGTHAIRDRLNYVRTASDGVAACEHLRMACLGCLRVSFDQAVSVDFDPQAGKPFEFERLTDSQDYGVTGEDLLAPSDRFDF
jgi:hypothetical protein